MLNPFDVPAGGGDKSKKKLSLSGADLASSALAMKDGKGTWKGFGKSSSMSAGKKVMNWSKGVLGKNHAKIVEAWEKQGTLKPLPGEERSGIAGWAAKLLNNILPYIDAGTNIVGQIGGFFAENILNLIPGGWKTALAIGVGAGLIVGGSWVVAGGLAGAIGLKGLWLWLAQAGAATFTAAMLPSMVNWIADKVQQIWEFDWNTTDEDLEREVQAAFDAIYGILGESAGKILGQACGAIPGLITVWVKPRLLLQVREALGQEALSQMIDSLYTITNWSKQVFGKWLFSAAYSNGRKLVKWVVRNSAWVQDIIGERLTKAILESWGEKGSKPWTFAQQYEKMIDSIKNEKTKAFVENMFEAFFESCYESSLVWAESVAY